MNEREQRIREWAYRLWEQEGYPHGRDGDHWFRATAIVLEEDGLPAPAVQPAAAEMLPAPKRSRAKPAALTEAPVPAKTVAKTSAKAGTKAAPKAVAKTVAKPAASEAVAPAPGARRKRS